MALEASQLTHIVYWAQTSGPAALIAYLRIGPHLAAVVGVDYTVQSRKQHMAKAAVLLSKAELHECGHAVHFSWCTGSRS